MNKISETLLEFAQPIIETLPPNPTLQIRRLALEIAATVWNAIVIEAWGGEGKELGLGTLTELKERLAGLPEPIGTTMGPIIDRLAPSKPRATPGTYGESGIGSYAPTRTDRRPA